MLALGLGQACGGGGHGAPATGRDAGAADCVTAATPLEPGAGTWDFTVRPTAPVPMDDVTVFAFSQVGTHGSDPQLLALGPDMSIRTWTHWDREGLVAADYNLDYLAACHAAKVRFIGGQSTTTFADEWDTRAAFEAVATRDAAGGLVAHDDIVPGLHFGSWSNPTFRDHLLASAKLQIDGGADGMFFDVVEGDFTGASFDADEGFDDYHLADFNDYLLAKYPAGTDFASRFDMLPGNSLNAGVPPGDLGCNFNYRTYLAGRGLSAAPFSPSNPLGAEWTSINGNRPQPGPFTFERAVTYRRFRDVVAALRDYARQQYGRDIYVTANGIFPFVDFQSVGLYGYNGDAPGGGEAEYVPVSNGHLAGGQSLQPVFVNLRTESASVAPGAPVVLFIDWPSRYMTNYLGLPPTEREDYWRIYAAEAYANGLFFAFHLADTIGDPTASDLGLMPLFQQLAGFYRGHAALYHHAVASGDAVTSSLASAMVAVADQESPRRRVVHVVNHEYTAGLVPQENVTITVPLPAEPVTVTIASPDSPADVPADQYRYAAGQLTVTLPSLIAYDMVIVSY